MQLAKYQEFIEVTWNKETNQEIHVHLLLTSEVGELASAYKKVFGYGRKLDRVNVVEELGDLFYGICTTCRLKGIEIDWTELSNDVGEEHITEENIAEIVDTLLLNAIMMRTCTNEEFMPILDTMMSHFQLVMFDINTDLEEVTDRNYEKLIVRYPDFKFSGEHSEKRFDKL